MNDTLYTLLLASTGNFEIYIQIVSYIIPPLAMVLVWLILRHFELKERIRALEINSDQKLKDDLKQDDSLDKIWSAIDEIKQIVVRLDSEFKLIIKKQENEGN